MVKKITIITFLLFFLSCFFYTSPIFATSGSLLSDVTSKRDIFEGRGANKITPINASGLVNGLAGVLTTFGVLVVFAGLLIIGIKYMVATPEEAAKLKTKLIGLTIAGVLIIGAYGIWNLVVSLIWEMSRI